MNRLEELIDLAADGLASEADLKELDLLMQTDSAQSLHAVKLLQVEALMRGSFDRDVVAQVRERLAQERVRQRVQAKVQRPSARWQRSNSSNSAQSRPLKRRRSKSRPAMPIGMVIFGAVAVAALLIIAINVGQRPTPVSQSEPMVVSPNPVRPVINPEPALPTMTVSIDGRVQIGGQTYRSGQHQLPIASLIQAADSRLTLADGSIIDLFDAELQLPDQPGSYRFAQQAGTVVWNVAPRTGGDTFQVHTDDGVITVIGTAFEITKDRTTTVAVHHGQVEVVVDDEQALLAAGDVVELNGENIDVITSPTGFVPINAADIKLYLIDGPVEQTATHGPEITAGSTIDLADYPNGINILLDVPDRVESIQARLDPDHPYTVPPIQDRGHHLENLRPFSLWGDDGEDGAHHAVKPVPGPLLIKIVCCADHSGLISIGEFEWPVTIIDTTR